LATFNKGRDYIRYYYILSYFTQDDEITSTSIAGYIALFNALYPKIAKTMSSGDCNEILITTSMKNAILAYLETYRGYSSNSIYLDVLDSVEADVTHFANMTKSDIFDELDIPSPCGGFSKADNKYESDKTMKTQFSIYPNPAKKLITIQCNDFTLRNREALVELYDIDGKLLYKKQIILNPITVIDLTPSNLAPGTTLIKISPKDSKTITQKLMIL